MTDHADRGTNGFAYPDMDASKVTVAVLEVEDEDDVRTDGGEDCEEADRC